MQAPNQVYDLQIYKPGVVWAVVGGVMLLAGALAAALDLKSGGLVTVLFLALVVLSYWLGQRIATSQGQAELTPTELRIRRGSAHTEILPRTDIVAYEASISDDGRARLLLRLRSGKRTELVMRDEAADPDSAFERLAVALEADLARA